MLFHTTLVFGHERYDIPVGDNHTGQQLHCKKHAHIPLCPGSFHARVVGLLTSELGGSRLLVHAADSRVLALLEARAVPWERVFLEAKVTLATRNPCVHCGVYVVEQIADIFYKDFMLMLSKLYDDCSQ